jgi:hypothetical protein
MANNTVANSTDITSNDRAGLLGILWAVYGIVRLVIALVLIFFNGIATVMFGALLTRVPNPFALMTDFHILYVFIIVWNILSGIVALGAAGGLLGRGSSAPKIVILAAFLALPVLPFGVMLGVYTLIVFLPSRRTSLDSPRGHGALSLLRLSSAIGALNTRRRVLIAPRLALI